MILQQYAHSEILFKYFLINNIIGNITTLQIFLVNNIVLFIIEKRSPRIQAFAFCVVNVKGRLLARMT